MTSIINEIYRFFFHCLNLWLYNRMGQDTVAGLAMEVGVGLEAEEVAAVAEEEVEVEVEAQE